MVYENVSIILLRKWSQ